MKRTALSIIALFALLVCALVAQTLKADATSLITGPSFQGPITPTQPGHRLRFLTLSETSVIGGTAFSGRVTLQFVAPRGGTTVSLSTDPLPGIEGENLAFVPSHVEVPRGEASATFQVRTNPVQSTRQVTIIAKAGGVTRTASFTVQPLQVAGFVITPTFGVGPFQARAAVTLNAPAVSETEVTLTSSNPAVVGFGIVGTLPTRTVTFQQGERSLTNISLGTRSVQQRTTVTIVASLNGSTQSRPMTVNPIP